MNHTQYTWGLEMVWADTENYSAVMMVIKDGEKTQYIYHKKRDKTLFILQGTVQLTVEGQKKMLTKGQSVHIGAKIMHRLAALKGDATVLEAGTKILDDIVIVEE